MGEKHTTHALSSDTGSTHERQRLRARWLTERQTTRPSRVGKAYEKRSSATESHSRRHGSCALEPPGATPPPPAGCTGPTSAGQTGGTQPAGRGQKPPWEQRRARPSSVRNTKRKAENLLRSRSGERLVPHNEQREEGQRVDGSDGGGDGAGQRRGARQGRATIGWEGGRTTEDDLDPEGRKTNAGLK